LDEQTDRPLEEGREGSVSRMMRTSLTEKDNHTFDVARISFALVMAGWFLSLATFLAMTIIQFYRKGNMDGFPAGIAVLFGTLSGVLPCASWAIRLKGNEIGG
jgi:hypothetical protein